MRIFALEFILIAIAMNNVSSPKITTTVRLSLGQRDTSHVSRRPESCRRHHVRIVTSQQTYCHDERT